MMILLFSRSSVKHWKSDLAPFFALWSRRPEKICIHCNYWLFVAVWYRQLKIVLLPFFTNHSVLLIISRVCGVVKGSWSDDLVAKCLAGPNTLFCVWRSWCDSTEKWGVTREVYEDPAGFFLRALPGVTSNHRSACSGMQCLSFRSNRDLINLPVEPGMLLFIWKKPKPHTSQRTEWKQKTA